MLIILYVRINDLFVGEELLTPTIIYVRSLLALMRRGLVKGYAHITGGGLVGNIPRALPNGVRVRLDANKWIIPSVFTWLQKLVCSKLCTIWYCHWYWYMYTRLTVHMHDIDSYRFFEDFRF